MSRSPSYRASGTRLLLTCEHAGNRIPREHRELFRGAGRVLASHRGWDRGALAAARYLAARLEAPLRSVALSRLLVDANRAPSNPRIWSAYTAPLARDAKARIVERYWGPHRRRVEADVRAAVAAGERAVHVAVHSFAPVLDGERRRADVGLLYDPKRPREARLCRRWQSVLRGLAPTLRVRRNYPYSGVADGLTTWLRRRFPDPRYAGVELELNQALLDGPRRLEALRALARAFELLHSRETRRAKRRPQA